MSCAHAHRRLLAHDHLDVTQNLVAEHVTSLNNIYNLTFFSSPALKRATASWKSGLNSSPTASISTTPFCRNVSSNFCATRRSPSRRGRNVLALLRRGNGTLHVVQNREHALQYVGAAARHQIHLLAQRTLAIVVELGLQTQILVTPLLDKLLGRNLRSLVIGSLLLRRGSLDLGLRRRVGLVCHFVSLSVTIICHIGIGCVPASLLAALATLLSALLNIFIYKIML